MEFYFVFEGLEFFKKYDEILPAIKEQVFERIDEIESMFSSLSYNENGILLRLANSSRKLNKMYDPRFKSSLNSLLKTNFIKLEKTHESAPVAVFGQKLSRELRRYQVSDKIHFSKNFYHFYFKFIKPNLNTIKNGDECDKNALLQEIKSKLESYYSLPFELICAKFLCLKLGLKDDEISSYWDKNNEIDIFVNCDKISLAGEVKYKAHKVCKSLLSELQAKCENIGFKPEFYALFSRYGFSKELENLKAPNVLLFEPNDFKEVL